MEEQHAFQLSSEESKYLKELGLHDAVVANLLRFKEDASGRNVTMLLSRAETEELRDYLTTRLAAVGFDQTYSPNEEGQMLEALIDKLFLP